MSTDFRLFSMAIKTFEEFGRPSCPPWSGVIAIGGSFKTGYRMVWWSVKMTLHQKVYSSYL
jgi:hypothetical protein